MLTIYRASAGAGKTHQLTGEYLLLLFSQLGEYRRILAVTFTNKATDEMKGRIVEELFNLATERKSDYVRLLSETYSLTEPQVRAQAKKILIAILHDYSAFNISTIDRFFQQTMRAFTREIGLQGGFGIEMDKDLVLTEAIDRLLGGLDSPESKELLGWLLRFAEEKVESGKSWNLRHDIKTLGQELFKESYKVYSEELAKDLDNKNKLEEYKESLYSIIRSVEKQIKDIGQKGLDIISSYGLTVTDFKGGSRSPMLAFERWSKGVVKEPSKTFCGVADNVEACFTKTMPDSQKLIIQTAFEDGLNECIKEAIARFEDMTDYNTAQEIVRFYYTLGILSDISRKIADYREDKNVMLIADTTELLNKVIEGSDAPFIYEKTGTQVDHYMIDEFQDTSNMQWNNFRPLLEESLAHNRANLIVGDVKQSIYRFRNSDWKLLDEKVSGDFAPDEVKEETLKDNWRSCRHIVEFNNALFTAAPFVLQMLYNADVEESVLTDDEKAILSTRIMKAYQNCYQHIPKPLQGKEGHVKIEFIEEEEDEKWEDEALNRLPYILQELQTNGYELKDIAILVRKNDEGAKVANSLLAYKEENPDDGFNYDIISDEALYVNSSQTVRFLIIMMRYLKNPDNKTWSKMVLFAYKQLTACWTVADFSDEEKSVLRHLSTLPLYEMVEGLYRLFEKYIAESEQIFVLAFLDMVASRSQQENTDLGLFLNWWDETGYKKTIATPEGQNAIRILTVHKSKGLGFKAVIMPFGNWKIDHNPTLPVTIWCHPEKKPFDNLKLVPVRYSTNLKSTIFAKDYFEEKLYAFIDSLNTLYVAFTRAKEELIVLSPRPKRGKKDESMDEISGIADLLWFSLKQNITETADQKSLVSLVDSFNQQADIFELGTWWKTEKKHSEALVEELSVGRMNSVSVENRLHLRLRGKNYFFNNTQRKHGTLLHEVLSRIKTVQDIPSAVHQYEMQGVISKEEEAVLVKKLHSYLEIPEVKPWYDGKARILNEVDILLGKGVSKRPDRVMIYDDKVVILDYKFGEKISRNYQSQIRNYVKLIREMGYRNVTGYLWYVTLSKIEKVNA